MSGADPVHPGVGPQSVGPVDSRRAATAGGYFSIVAVLM